MKEFGINVTLVEPADFQCNTQEVKSDIPDYKAAYDWYNELAKTELYGDVEKAMSLTMKEKALLY
ncbi:hypothetical protein [Cytobacillus purgationiresistens]|uniref:tRNA(Leu) C34 or U34 (Ribose-2'-O)-methylase TrmL n=1 Tax=Cytobacillus purgationiresistens TaxID=863449 RepID=A0ABU0AFG1_9BACI|nr:hypothetical protein [Cytobacillus purgationiresistens]MDQ0269599.1 tRNA(Leu) C34 or U34 (ribose-2'-O)-methylase TrmL [Cytobacillus purgationiresistens]